MKIITVLSFLLIGLVFAELNPESIYPQGCKRKGNLVKCPIKKYNAGEIFDLENKLVYGYYPQSEGQTEMAYTKKCKNILPYPTIEWQNLHNVEDYASFTEYMYAAINSQQFEFVCEESVNVKDFFCQEDKKRVLIIKYDDLGIEDEQIKTTTDNPRYCKEKFDKKFR